MHRKPSASIAAVLFAFVALLLPAPARAQGYVDAEFSVDHDSNISNASHGGDELDDNILIFGLSANRPQPLTARSGLLLTGRAEYDRYTLWEDLSHFSIGGKIAWRYQPGTSYDAIWYEISSGATLLKHQDSRLRDGGIVFADLSLGSRVTDRLQLRAGYRYRLRRSWDGNVFDNEGHRVYASGDWQAADRLLFYATAGWQTGDAVSTSRQDPAIGALATAMAADWALGTWKGLPRVAYRIDADTVTGEFGFNYEIRAGLALDVSARYLHTDGPSKLSYDGLRILGGLLYRF
jgi:hypothetical protein